MSSVAPPTVRVLAVSRVAQELDAQLITRQPVQQVFLYELSSADEFPAAVRRLMGSLAAALAVFLPLAGKLVYAEDTGDVVVDCSGPGVAFFEAEVAAAAAAERRSRSPRRSPARRRPSRRRRSWCWASLVRCRSLAPGPGHAAHLAFPVDLRARLCLPAGYIGVCIKKCLASADAGDLVGGAGLLRAARAIQEAVREVGAAPLARTEAAWGERVARVPAEHLAVVAGCPVSYRLYETADFGFGKPVLADDVPLDYDGRMVLSAGRRSGE
ncbi:unnamed protein product, partial [Urochloa decumbens]